MGSAFCMMNSSTSMPSIVGGRLTRLCIRAFAERSILRCICRMSFLFTATSRKNKPKEGECYKKNSDHSEKRSAAKLKSARRRFGPGKLRKRDAYAADIICPEERSNQREK